jgi:3-phenylpropionate/cinnamic acid dioxygenase small subunit
MNQSNRNIPSAGPDFEHLLAQDVVIDAQDTAGDAAKTGAQALEPSHSPVRPSSLTQVGARPLPAPAQDVDPALRRQVEQFLYRQAELLDGKHWQAFIDLFAPDGVYWMPVTLEQTDWQGEPSIFAEDRLMMEIRKDRVQHPNAWSQAPMWETNHIVSHIAIESIDQHIIVARARFHMMELRRDSIRHFGGSYRHTLVRDSGGALRIRLQRVDLFNGQAPFDYVLQVWV